MCLLGGRNIGVLVKIPRRRKVFSGGGLWRIDVELHLSVDVALVVSSCSH